MTRDAFVRGVLRLVTVDAETHIEVHDTFGHRLLSDVPMTRGAVDAGANMRRVVEPDVRRVHVSVNTLPGDVNMPCFVRGHVLDGWPIRGNRGVADHARLHARKAGNRTLLRALMAVVSAGQPLGDVDIVRKRDRLDDIRPHAKEVSDGIPESPVRRRVEIW